MRMGFAVGAADDTYDDGTAAAVAAWYTQAGWAPQGPTDEQQQALRAAQTDANATRTDNLTARESLAAAQGALATAKDRVTVARAGATAALGADAATLATRQRERLLAEVELLRADGALLAAQDGEQLATLRLIEAGAADPPLTASEPAVLAAALRDATSTVSVARADLAAVRAALTGLPAPGASGAAQAAADHEVSSAEAEVARATGTVTLAAGRVAQASGPGAAISVAELAATFGIQVPADEVLFFPALPLRVDQATLAAGAQVSAPVMSVSTSRLTVAASLSPADAQLVATGAAVTIEATELGVRGTGTVTTVAETPGTRVPTRSASTSRRPRRTPHPPWSGPR